MRLSLALIIVVKCCLANEEEGAKDEFTDYVIGTFSRVVRTPNFLDTTELIYDFFDDDKCVAIIEQDHCGKSSTLDMVKMFCEHVTTRRGVPIDRKLKKQTRNYEIYSKIYYPSTGRNVLEIFKEQNFFKKYFGCYPIVYMDFKTWSGHDYDVFLSDCRKIFFSVYDKNVYLVGSKALTEDEIGDVQSYYVRLNEDIAPEDDLQACMPFLCEMLHKHFGEKVIVLIDNYQRPVGEAFERTSEIFQKVSTFFESLMHNLLNSTHVEKGLIMAAQKERFARGLVIPKFVHQYNFTFKHKYREYFRKFDAKFS